MASGRACPSPTRTATTRPSTPRKLTFGDINGGLNYAADENVKLIWGRWNAGRTTRVHSFGQVTFSDVTEPERLIVLTRRALMVDYGDRPYSTCPENNLGCERVLSHTICKYAGSDREETMVDYNTLNEDQKAKKASARTPEDNLKIAQEEGYELSDEELEQVVGGFFGYVNDPCPRCGKGRMVVMKYNLTCNKCGYTRYTV